MVLTTFRADGSLQSSPVSGGVDDDGRIVIASYPQRAKSANIRRTPTASVTVLSCSGKNGLAQGPGAHAPRAAVRASAGTSHAATNPRK